VTVWECGRVSSDNLCVWEGRGSSDNLCVCVCEGIKGGLVYTW
jgi:hypothetical protein